MFDQATMKLHVEPLLLSALREAEEHYMATGEESA